MGHADLRMTKRYTELDESYIAQQHNQYAPVELLRQAQSTRVRNLS